MLSDTHINRPKLNCAIIFIKIINIKNRRIFFIKNIKSKLCANYKFFLLSNLEFLIKTTFFPNVFVRKEISPSL